MDSENFNDLFLEIKPEEFNIPVDDWFSNLNTDDLLTDVMSDNAKIKPLNVDTMKDPNDDRLSEEYNFSPPTVKSSKIVDQFDQKVSSVHTQSPQSCDSGLMCSDPDSNQDMEINYKNPSSDTAKFSVQPIQIVNNKIHSLIPHQMHLTRSRKADQRSSRSYQKETFKSEILDNYDSYKRHKTTTKRKDVSSFITDSPSGSSVSESDSRTLKYFNNNTNASGNNNNLKLTPSNKYENSLNSPYDSAEDDDLSFYKGKSYTSSGRQISTANSTTYSKNQPKFQNPISQNVTLMLSDEEKKTMLSEGYSIPTRLPLTKQEERNLKKIRRKIKNKISAQESRRKKKEYLETLEKRVDSYSSENCDLKRRVDSLESSNRSLLSQLRHLQQLLIKANNQNGKNNNTTIPKATNNSRLSSHHHHHHSNHAYSSNGNSNNNEQISIHSNGNGRNGSGDNSVESGAHASTCLMMFVLCFAVLLAGQGTPPSHNTSKSLILKPHDDRPAEIFRDTTNQQHGNSFNSGPLIGNRSPPDKDLSFWPENDLPWEQIKPASTSPEINLSIDEIFDAVKTIDQETDQIASRPQEKPLKRKQQFNSGIRQKRQSDQDKSRILGSLRELEEYDESCEPPTIWSYLFSDNENDNDKSTCNSPDQSSTGPTDTKEESLKSTKNSLDSSLANKKTPCEKRKIIKIYTHDENIFKRHHDPITVGSKPVSIISSKANFPIQSKLNDTKSDNNTSRQSNYPQNVRIFKSTPSSSTTLRNISPVQIILKSTSSFQSMIN